MLRSTANCTIVNIADERKRGVAAKVMIDTEGQRSWMPAALLERVGVKREGKKFAVMLPNGKGMVFDIGFAVLRVGNRFTVDEVVFAEMGMPPVLGARALKGLDLVVDPKSKTLVAAEAKMTIGVGSGGAATK